MKRVLTIIMLLMLSSCTILAEFTDPVQADYMNPCTEQVDCEECRAWALKYPEEYKRYAKRMHPRKIKFCRF